MKSDRLCTGGPLGLLLLHRIDDAMLRRVVPIVLLVSGGTLLLLGCASAQGQSSSTPSEMAGLSISH
jgi:uncharacterized membrane protein YfcA